MPPQRPQQRHELVEWYHSIPPITRAILTLSIATTATTTFGLYRFNSLIYYWPAISHKFQVKWHWIYILLTDAHIFMYSCGA
jgi:derlin-1